MEKTVCNEWGNGLVFRDCHQITFVMLTGFLNPLCLFVFSGIAH